MNDFNDVIKEINQDIDLLYIIPCLYTRNIILNRIRENINLLECINNSVNNAIPDRATKLERLYQEIASIPRVERIERNTNGRTFTLAELSQYDGKNGNPAYVAVNGIVYNVTNNATWAAATHFGLSAGKDLSSEFASCHAGQNVLNRLEVIGRLE